MTSDSIKLPSPKLNALFPPYRLCSENKHCYLNLEGDNRLLNKLATAFNLKRNSFLKSQQLLYSSCLCELSSFQDLVCPLHFSFHRVHPRFDRTDIFFFFSSGNIYKIRKTRRKKCTFFMKTFTLSNWKINSLKYKIH